MTNSTLPLYERIEFPVEVDERGKLTYIEQSEHVPLEFERIYYIFDVPETVIRGQHAHRELHQIMIPLPGRLDVVVDDGERVDCVKLSDPAEGLFVPEMRWRIMTNFDPGTVCLVLASETYDPDDYIHDYEEFISIST
jgi:dTDP-4-dehydrorhamnose 3,5-epimerase-like enzyme